MLNVDEAQNRAKKLSVALWEKLSQGEGVFEQVDINVLSILFKKVYQNDPQRQRQLVLALQEKIYTFLIEDDNRSLSFKGKALENTFTPFSFGAFLASNMDDVVQVYRSYEPGGDHYFDMASWVQDRKDVVLKTEEHINRLAQNLALYDFFGLSTRFSEGANKHFILPYLQRRIDKMRRQCQGRGLKNTQEKEKMWKEVCSAASLVGPKSSSNLLGSEEFQKHLKTKFLSAFDQSLEQVFLSLKNLDQADEAKNQDLAKVKKPLWG